MRKGRSKFVWSSDTQPGEWGSDLNNLASEVPTPTTERVRFVGDPEVSYEIHRFAPPANKLTFRIYVCDAWNLFKYV